MPVATPLQETGASCPEAPPPRRLSRSPREPPMPDTQGSHRGLARLPHPSAEGAREGIGCWGVGGTSEKRQYPLSTVCPPPRLPGDCPYPSHSPCEHGAHCREEPLGGVGAEDGHAVGPLQAELQTRKMGQVSSSGGAETPSQGPPKWRRPVDHHSAAPAVPPRAFPGSRPLGPAAGSQST